MTFALTHSGRIEDDAEITRLILVAQSAPVTAVEDFDVTTGKIVERTVYGSTPESEDALRQLVEAFLPLLKSAARRYTGNATLPFEDAFSTATEEFISCVRRHVVGSSLPFRRIIATTLHRRLDDEARVSGMITVTENRAALYRQILAAHGGVGDREERALRAYEFLRTGGKFSDLTAQTFLDVHRAVTSKDSLDAPAAGTLHDDASSRHEAALADTSVRYEEETLQAETVRWLFSLVTDEQERILRLRYGFNDLPTENLRRSHGYRMGEVLSDQQVAYVVGSNRPAVQRKKVDALKKMRTALEEAEIA